MIKSKTMKVTIKTTEPQSREIDWSKPMVVVSDGVHILTTGRHKSTYFEGVRLETGELFNDWNKSVFTPCTTPVTITFENEL